MSLVIDNRAALNGGPGIHALIIGVSAYPLLPTTGSASTQHSYGMSQLSSTALAAFRVFQWLKSNTTQFPVPLATCRLLLLPSQDEINAEPELATVNTQWASNPDTSLTEVLKACSDWRNDSAVHRDGMTFFYFAGHGVQRTAGDSVMLLPGFGSGIGGTLHHAIDTSNLFAGMAPTPQRSQIAQTQLYFVDACRILPEEFKKFELMPTTPVFNIELPSRDDRKAPIFYAAIPGTVANGIRGKQTVFSKALIDCLRGLAGEALEEDADGNVPWNVSIHSLDRALPRRMSELNSEFNATQEYHIGGSLKNTTICSLNGAPLINVHVEVDPFDASRFGTLKVEDFRGTSVWNQTPPLNPHPCVKQLPAGVYTIKVEFTPPLNNYKNFTRSKQLHPPKAAITAKVVI